MNINLTQIEIESGLATTQGLFYMKMSQYKQAIPYFDKAIEINADNWNALQARSFCKDMLFADTPDIEKESLQMSSDLTLFTLYNIYDILYNKCDIS